MRLIENILLLVLLFALAWAFLPERRRPRAVLYIPFLALAVMIAHWIVEGYRWQMLPVYLVALILLGVSLVRLLGSQLGQPLQMPRRPVLRFLSILVALLIFLVISQPPIILPVFSLPEPEGPYSVGTASLVLPDPARPESFTSDTADIRQVPLQVWYPSVPPGSAKAEKYWLGYPEFSRVLTAELELPSFLLDHTALVQTHSYAGQPVVSGESAFPVLIFSHGYRLGYLQQNTSLMETLASHGYVVISVGHPYEALAVPLADGKTARYASETQQTFMDNPSIQEISLSIWADDVRLALDTLPAFQQGIHLPQLAGRLDLEHIGLFGMSFGGSTASLICLNDSRCKAGLTLDSPQYSAVESGQLEQPFLFMVSDNGKYLEKGVYESATGPAILVTVQGSEHYNFTDLTLVSPLAPSLGFSGPIDGNQMVRIMNEYTLAFFDKYLKGESEPLLNGISSEFPEVQIESRNTR